jgi:tetratricopeptide (TPR) repeat protein
LGAVLALALVIVLAVVLAGPTALLAHFHANLGAVYQSRAELSVYSWPEWWGLDEVRRAVDLGPAVAEFERALALDPANGTANRRLGTIELSLGQYEDALDHLQAAYATEGWSVTTRQLLGEALIVNGRVDEGRALWADVNNEQRQLVYRAEWYGHIGEPEREAAIRQAAAGY